MFEHCSMASDEGFPEVTHQLNGIARKGRKTTRVLANRNSELSQQRQQ